MSKETITINHLPFRKESFSSTASLIILVNKGTQSNEVNHYPFPFEGTTKEYSLDLAEEIQG